MTDINRINQGPEFRGKITPKKETDNNQVNKPETEAAPTAPQTNFKEADEVLNFLNNTSLIPDKTESKSTKKVIPVSQYVNPEQAQRIANAVNVAFGTLLKLEEAAVREFGLSKPAAQALAVDSFEARYLQ